jgi:hypothetical protein
MNRIRRGALSLPGVATALVIVAACSSSDGALVASSTATTTAATAATTAATAATTAATTRQATATTAATTATTATTAQATAAGGVTEIKVPSSTSQYFVLYVKPDLNAATEIPVAIVRGAAGTTTVTDGRRQLPTDHYRVATFTIDKPGDVDGDGVDDLTELADPVNANPLNPAPKLDAQTGAVIVSDTTTFANLSYQGDDVARDQYLAGLEFMKFWIVGTNTTHPAVYFMNTNTYNAHPPFASAVGIAAGRGPTPGAMRGDIVYNPDGIAPDGSKGTYRFAFQPNDAFAFTDIALAYELLASSMPMLDNNLLYYPFPQSALPLYQKEKALYDAYRVPVLVQ